MKIIANKKSYGFRNKYWIEGEAAELQEGEEFPKEHFDIEGAESEEEAPKKPAKKK